MNESDYAKHVNAKRSNDGQDEEEILDVENKEQLIENQFSVVTTEELQFYAYKGEKAYVTLNFYNPDQFEIMSFILNGTKYQSYQFSEESTSTTILVSIVMPTESGIVEFTVDEVKYIDGTEIKNVTMDGNTTIKGAVAYDALPFVNVNVTPSYSKISVEANVSDVNNLISTSKGQIKAFVFDEMGLVASKDLVLGDNSFEFDKLKVNSLYNIVISASYDCYDGKGVSVVELYSNNFETFNCIDILNEKVSSDSISFEVISNVENFTLNSVELLKDNIVMKQSNELNSSFKDLLSDTMYDIKVKYTYEDIEYTFVKQYKTIAKAIPNVGLKITELTDKTIAGSVVIFDADNTLESIVINLYSNNNLIKSISELNENYEFEININSNTSYKLEVVYSYDLSSGNGISNDKYEYEFTSSIQLPTAELNIVSITDKTVSFDVVETDINQVGSVTAIKLYKGEILVKNVSLTDYNVTDLTSSTVYKIVVVYTYDLNNGLGAQSFEVSQEFKTWNEAPVFDINTSVDKSSVNYEVLYTDKSNTIEIESVELKKNDVVINTTQELIGSFIDLLSNNEYKVVVNYSYLINETDRENLVYEKTVKTNAYVTPVLGINFDTISDLSISGSVNVSDPDSLLSIESIELYQTGNLVASLTDTTEFEFITSSNVKYQIVVNYSYDLHDGQGVENSKYEYEFYSNKQVPEVEINVISVSDSTMSFDVVEIDENQVGSITAIKLYKGETLVKNVSLTDYNLKDLTSATNYKLVVVYTFDLNNGLGSQNFEVYKEFKTWNGAPILDVTTSTDKSSIEYNVLYTDKSNTFEIETVELKKNDVVVNSGNELSGKFNDLLSNNEYKLVVNYSYLVNDTDRETLTYECVINTVSYAKPVVGILVENITVQSIEGKVALSDSDGLVTINSIELYQQGNLLSVVNNSSRFEFVTVANVQYQIVVNYSYNLNDGKGEVLSQVTQDVTTSKGIPTIKISPYNITQNDLYYDLSIVDMNASGNLSSIRLYQGNNYICQMNQFDTHIGELSSNTDYKIIVVYRYDLDDGTGAHDTTYTYEFKTLKEQPEVYISINEVTKESISIDYNVNDPQQALTFKSVELYLNGVVVEEYDTVTRNFTELLSNSTYNIVVKYSADLNNSEYEIVSSLSTTTYIKETPNVEFNLSSTKTSVEYSYLIIDTDNVSTVQFIDLYLDGVKQDVTSSNNVYKNLWSGREYELVISLLCDYNDGLDPVVKTYSEKITTEALKEPTVSLNFESTQSTIEGSTSFVDNEDILVLDRIEVYNGEVLVSEITDINEFSLEDLVSNTVYSFVLYYGYDLNDGAGFVEKQYTQDYSTLAYNVEVDSYLVLNEGTPKTNDVISIRLNLINQSNIVIDKLMINGEYANIIGGDYVNTIIFVITASEVSGVMEINVEKFAYELNGISVVQDITQDLEIRIQIASRLGVINMSTFDASDIVKSSLGTGIVIEVDNPDGYEVVECELSNYEWNNEGTRYTDLIIIDDNHFYLPIQINNTGSNYFKVYSIVYNVDGERVERNYNDTFYITSTLLDYDENTYALNTGIISTPEDLMNIQSGYSYELACDIDMTGYTWKPIDFTGYIDGKGHTISNMIVHVENEYNTYQEYAVFTKFDGTIKNIYFKDIFYNIQTTGSPVMRLLAAGGSYTASGIIFSGSMSITANGYKVDNENGYYTVGQFKVNGEVVGENENFVNSITKEVFESEEFRKETLNWNFVEKQTSVYEGLAYTLIDDSYIFINGYEGEGSVVNVPETINGYPVLGIADKAFAYNNVITEVTIPNTIIYMGGSMFAGCSNLESISIPRNKARIDESLEYVSMTYFFGNVEYENSYIARDGSVYVPNTLEKIVFTENEKIQSDLCGFKSLKTIILNMSTNTSFSNCESLEYVDLGIKITKLSGSLFANNKSLKEVIIPETVTVIESDVFYDCSSLQSVYLPDSITEMSWQIFFECTSLTEVHLPANITEIPNSTFTNCQSLKSIDIPEGVTRIGGQSFSGCTSLTTVNMGNNVVKIEGTAFRYCNKLVNINFSTNLVSVGEQAFYGCNSLLSVDLSLLDELMNIENEAFRYCDNLTYVDLSSNLISIGANAFSDCKSLETVILSDTIETIGNGAFRYCEKIVDINFPTNLVSIGYEAFQYCKLLEEVILGDKVETIGYSAFANCESLITVVLSDELETIGDQAFLECSKLVSIELPETITYIGESAFRYCTKLSSINLPDSITTIENGAFSNCQSLKEVVLPKGITKITDGMFATCIKLETVVLHDGITIIEDNAFNYCQSLTEIIIPDGVTSIGDGAFESCGSLQKVYLSDSVETIGEAAFSYCGSLNEVRLSKKLTVISNRVFGNSVIQNLIIYKNIVTIEDCAFENGGYYNIYYEGTSEDWSNISIGGSNNIYDTIMHYENTEPVYNNQ